MKRLIDEAVAFAALDADVRDLVRREFTEIVLKYCLARGGEFAVQNAGLDDLERAAKAAAVFAAAFLKLRDWGPALGHRVRSLDMRRRNSVGIWLVEPLCNVESTAAYVRAIGASLSTIAAVAREDGEVGRPCRPKRWPERSLIVSVANTLSRHKFDYEPGSTRWFKRIAGHLAQAGNESIDLDKFDRLVEEVLK